jgi:hypothetical protein
MKALKQNVQEKVNQKKEYQYTGNELVNEIERPKSSYFMFPNDDIENTELTDFEFRLLLKLYSMKHGRLIDNKAIAKKYKKTVITINRTLESLIKKQYIHISSYKQLTIRRISSKCSPLPIPISKALYIKYVQKIE